VEDRKHRMSRVASRLEELRSQLPDAALKAYQALKQALRPHSGRHGCRPQFETDFLENLQYCFPHAFDIRVRQIGSWNQWEVTIDEHTTMFCSVRLEVLGSNQEFVKDLKQKARIVKETLSEDNGKWKRALLPENGRLFNYDDTLSDFEVECRGRVEGFRQQGEPSKRYSQMWVDAPACKRCGRPEEEDQLSGVHMCVVYANFQCRRCNYSWASHHARLRPDETLMGQQCSRCASAGVAKEWKPNTRGDDESRGQGGMHQSRLCDACREFGNCMGMFYDPFVLTTALSLVSGHFVQWHPFSEEMPELLLADLGKEFSGVQVCLQPHVYTAPWEEKPHSACDAEKAQGRHRWIRKDEPLLSAQAGIKDQMGFQKFLTKNEPGRVDALPRTGFLEVLPDAPFVTEEAMEKAAVEAFNAGEDEKRTGLSAMRIERHRPGTHAGDEAGGTSEVRRPEVEQIPKLNKFNKIGGWQPPQPSPEDYPVLASLQPLRRSQFLQIVLRQMPATDKSQETKLRLAEDLLTRNNANYEQAYNFVKSMGANCSADL